MVFDGGSRITEFAHLWEELSKVELSPALLFSLLHRHAVQHEAVGKHQARCSGEPVLVVDCNLVAGAASGLTQLKVHWCLHPSHMAL